MGEPAPAPAPAPARARRQARRFARDARRLAARHARGLGDARAELDAAAAEVEEAAAEGDAARLGAAVSALDALWDAHLAARAPSFWREYAVSFGIAVLLAVVLRAFFLDVFRIPWSSSSMAPTLLGGDALLVSKFAYAVRVPFTSLRLLETGVPRRGDVIVFRSPGPPGGDLVKRVVGVPGDVIELREGVLLVNGVPQPRTPDGEFQLTERTPAGATVSERCRRYREALAKGPLAAPAPGPEASPGAPAEAAWQEGAAAGVASYAVLQCRWARLGARQGPYPIVAPDHVFVLGDNRDLSADSREGGGWQVPVSRIRGRALRVLASSGPGGLRLERLFKPVE